MGNDKDASMLHHRPLPRALIQTERALPGQRYSPATVVRALPCHLPILCLDDIDHCTAQRVIRSPGIELEFHGPVLHTLHAPMPSSRPSAGTLETELTTVAPQGIHRVQRVVLVHPLRHEGSNEGNLPLTKQSRVRRRGRFRQSNVRHRQHRDVCRVRRFDRATGT